MNTQTIVLNKLNVVPNTQNTKYVYRFPKPFVADSHEVALSSLNMYYSFPNIQKNYKNNIFSYMWWDHLGNLTSRQDIIIPDGNYSISVLSDYIHSQMFLRGHYLKDASNQDNIYFISMIENPTYYATQITFTSMYAKGTTDAGTTYINENPPSQVYDNEGVLVWTGWDFPNVKQYPQVLFDDSYTMTDFLGFKAGLYPSSNTLVTTTFDILGQIAPATYPVSAINVQSNLCKSEIAIPDNILFSFSQGNSSYGDLINIEPKNLIWMRIPDGFYSDLQLQFVDQEFNPMLILDNQVNITLLIRDV